VSGQNLAAKRIHLAEKAMNKARAMKTKIAEPRAAEQTPYGQRAATVKH
jgi:hypothetical protein